MFSLPIIRYGSWDDGAYEMLEGIGKWMDINNEAIYDTRALSPYKEGKFCLTSHKDNSSVYNMALIP